MMPASKTPQARPIMGIENRGAKVNAEKMIQRLNIIGVAAGNENL